MSFTTADLRVQLQSWNPELIEALESTEQAAAWNRQPAAEQVIEELAEHGSPAGEIEEGLLSSLTRTHWRWTWLLVCVRLEYGGVSLMQDSATLLSVFWSSFCNAVGPMLPCVSRLIQPQDVGMVGTLACRPLKHPTTPLAGARPLNLGRPALRKHVLKLPQRTQHS